jgi:FkbM family methyltransferase
MITNFADYCGSIKFDQREWVWPKMDQKLKQVNSWADDLYIVFGVMSERGRENQTVIQAGGACGIWPAMLAEVFDWVITYEPDPLNFYCLEQNTKEYFCITAVNGALGETTGVVRTKLHPSEMFNVGAYYTMDACDGVPRVRIDDIADLESLDLLCLDIEGRELEALKGAYKSINKWQPFIMIEEKQLPQMGSDVKHKPGEATKWLIEKHGYKVVSKVHRDVILAPAA